jgi:hypothetical protein
MSFLRSLRSSATLLALLASLAPAASSQVAQSPNAKLLDWSCSAAGGGAASRRVFGWTTLGQLGSPILSAPNSKTGVGAAHTDDSTPLNNEPLVFGVVPPFGPKTGGTGVVVSGFNFDKLGVGPSVTMSVGGNGATGLSVLSNTQLTATTPAGTGINDGAGPQPVVVSSSLGSITHPEPYVNTPAVTSSPVALVGAALVLRNYGTPGTVFVNFLSDSSLAASTQFGTFLVAGGTLLQLFTNVPYPAPSGISTFVMKVPNLAVLHGLTLHFQSLSITSVSPLQGSLTNAAATTLP